MAMYRDFSVLMSVYFKEIPLYFEDALRSVFEQTIVPSQVVIVKDGQLGEGLDAVITKFKARYPKQLTIVPLEQNVGLGLALNEGLKYCSYDLVARMDSDDISKPDRFEKQLEIFEKISDVSVVGGWIEEFADNPKHIESRRCLPEAPHELYRYAKSRCPLNHMSVMFRKSDIERVGGYKHFYLLEDYWLWARMLSAGMKLYNVQQPLVVVRGGVAMLARRGGWFYAKSEVRLQREFLKLRFINSWEFMRNVTARLTIRMMPNRLRVFIYKKFLRT